MSLLIKEVDTFHEGRHYIATVSKIDNALIDIVRLDMDDTIAELSQEEHDEVAPLFVEMGYILG
jgi:hypothetical protein